MNELTFFILGSCIIWLMIRINKLEKAIVWVLKHVHVIPHDKNYAEQLKRVMNSIGHSQERKDGE